MKVRELFEALMPHTPAFLRQLMHIKNDMKNYETQHTVYALVCNMSHQELFDFVEELTRFERPPNIPAPDYKSKTLHRDLIEYVSRVIWWWDTSDQNWFIRERSNRAHDANIEQIKKQGWRWMAPYLNSDDIREEHEEVIYQLESDKEQAFLPGWVRDAYKKLQDEETWERTLIKFGRVFNITPRIQKKIGNTGDSWEDSNWKPESKERVEKLFNSGDSKNATYIMMPILLHNIHTGDLWLVGGHHRLTYCTQVLKKPAQCFVIDIDNT